MCQIRFIQTRKEFMMPNRLTDVIRIITYITVNRDKNCKNKIDRRNVPSRTTFLFNSRYVFGSTK